MTKSKRILYVSQSFYPSRAANLVHVLKMAQALSQSGHVVKLMLMRRRGDPSAHSLHAEFGLDASVDVIEVDVPEHKGWMLVYLVKALAAARRFKPDIIYSRFYPVCTVSSWLGYPTVLESHHPNRFDRLIPFMRLAALVVITNALKIFYRERFPRLSAPVIVAPDGADPIPQGIEPAVLPNAGRRLQVGYVGHLYPGKGMEVVHAVARACAWADFHVVGGDDDMLRAWQERSRDLENLFFHGYQPHSRVSSFILAFDVVLLPNQRTVRARHSGTEIGAWTSPLKAFEYMSAGRAIVASDLPVLREVLNDDNALLVPPDDISQWERALNALTDMQLRHSLGTQAHSDFSERYTWKLRARRIMEELPA